MPLFWLSLAFMAGIVLAARVQLTAGCWLVIAGVSLLIALVSTIWRARTRQYSEASNQRFKIHFPLLLFAAAAFALGGARYQYALPDHNSAEQIAFHNDRDYEVRVTGIVAQPPQVREHYSRVKLRAESIQRVGEAAVQPVNGLMVVHLDTDGDWNYGDRLQVRGYLETPPEYQRFSYRDYMAQQGVYSYMRDAAAQRLASGEGNLILGYIYTYKAYALDMVYRLWPDPEASLLAGILLGDESGIADDVDQAFRDTGTSHIIVISGFNITIVSALLVSLFSRIFGAGELGVRRAAVFALLGIAVYTLLVGADAAVVRAAIMGGLALFATLLGRRQTGLNTLAIVAAVMAALNPLVLWNIGFQLSFAATLGLVLYADPLKEAFERWAARFIPLERAQKWSPAVSEYLLLTLAAQVMVLPVIIYHFQRISISALVANPLVLPVQPPLMMLAGLALLAGTIYYPLGQILAWAAWPFVAYTIRVVELLAGFPGGAVSLGEVRLLLVIIFYALLFGLTFASQKYIQVRQAIRPGAVLVGLGLLTVLVWRMVMAAPDGKLQMTVLDVGTGDGILVQTPGGRSLLIDGGPSIKALSDALGRRLPLGSRQLDWLVVAAAGEGQIGSLQPNLERLAVSGVLWAGPRQGSYAARELQAYFTEKDIAVTLAAAGHVLDLGDGVELAVLEVGERGAVLLLSWGDFRVLLPIGINFEMLQRLEARPDLKGITALLKEETQT